MRCHWLVTACLVVCIPAQGYAEDARTGVMFYCHGCAHPMDDVICIGEAVSGRAIQGMGSHARNADSAIGTDGDKCIFVSESPIGRQIEKVCAIRDMNMSDHEGPICMVEAAIGKDLSIKRVIRIAKPAG